MRRLTGVSVLAVAIALTAVAPARSQEKGPKGKGLTITGVLIDTKCYSMSPANAGQDHDTPKGKMPNCAAACAKMGLPVAVLTPKGEVYVLVAPSLNFSDHMAREVRATGTIVYGHSLRPEKVEVRGKDGKWTEISLATMM